MEKEIIGYKLKESCAKYQSAVFSLLSVHKFNCPIQGYDLSQKWSIDICRNAGVLDLWFEPVYESPFKIGDWVTLDIFKLKNSFYDKAEFYCYTKLPSKTVCIENFGCNGRVYWENKFIIIKDNDYEFPIDCFRKATSEEVESVKTPNIIINDYKGEFFPNYVQFGCAKIEKNMIIVIYQLMQLYNESDLYKGITNVTIGKGTFTKEQIKKIVEYYGNTEN